MMTGSSNNTTLAWAVIGLGVSLGVALVAARCYFQRQRSNESNELEYTEF